MSLMVGIAYNAYNSIEPMLGSESHLYESIYSYNSSLCPSSTGQCSHLHVHTYTLNCYNVIPCLFNILYKCINRSLVFFCLTSSQCSPLMSSFPGQWRRATPHYCLSRSLIRCDGTLLHGINQCV